VCSLHHAQGDEEREFLVLASKPRSTVSPGLASKSVATVLVVWPQNHSLGFSGLGLKIGGCGLVKLKSLSGPSKMKLKSLLIQHINKN
jgi:hypothetical protein